MDETGKLYVVGIGPGSYEEMTIRAARALEESSLIVGYKVYVDLVREHFPNAQMVSTAMRQEVDRCRLALSQAAGGRTVSLVCSGDPGVYGMSGLVLQLCKEYPWVQVSIIPGVTAACSGGAILGAPVSHDFAVVSLSDLLTPWELIQERLVHGAKADLAICIYNPSSQKRAGYLERACSILLMHKSKETVCGIVRNIGRAGESREILTLAELKDQKVDMFATVFVGNSQTVAEGGWMITPRGYKNV